MKKIRLYCAGGMSTSMLVQRMQDVAVQENLEYDIKASGINDIFCGNCDADIILLGPQVGYQLSKVKETCPEIPAEVIDMVAYGMMDATKVMNQVKKMLD